jgi:hypothetical protein
MKPGISMAMEFRSSVCYFDAAKVWEYKPANMQTWQNRKAAFKDQVKYVSYI